MTTKPDTQADIAKLAGEEKPCDTLSKDFIGKDGNEIHKIIYSNNPHLEGLEDWFHEVCKGTGTVARFPEFRVECDMVEGRHFAWECDKTRDYGAKEPCVRTRPATLSEVKARLDDILVAQGIHLFPRSYDQQKYGCIARLGLSEDDNFWGFSDSPILAVIAALITMVEAE